MKETVNSYLDLVFKIGLVVVILSTLFLFTNLTTEFYDTPKFIILLLFTTILLIVLATRFALSGRVVLVRTPLDIPLLLLVVVGVVSTFLSPAPYVSVLGNQLRLSTSLIALVVYALFYFILTNSLKSLKDIKFIIFITIIAGAVLSVISLLAYMGVTLLPKPWTHGTNFTPTGSNFSTGAVLAILVPMVVMNILTSSKYPTLILNSILLTLFGLTIALTGTWASWVAALVGLGLAFFVQNPRLDIKQISPINLVSLVGPIIMVALVVTLSFIPPIGGAKNPFYTQAKNFPREIQLPFTTSWKTSVSAFRDSPFWGSGPSTYLFNFTNYKPIEFNQSKVWNLRFDSPFNEYLQVLATLGGIGLLALISLTAMFVSAAWRDLTRLSPTHQLPTTLSICGLTFFLILALHPSSLVVWVIGLLILAAFFVVNLLTGEPHLRPNYLGSSVKQILMRLASNVSSKESAQEVIKVDALPSIILIVVLFLGLTSLFFGGKFVLADYHHRIALNAVSQNNGVLTYNELVVAEKLNPYADLYRTDLAQTNFALANAIAQSKAPTEASPAGFLTDQDKQNIQVLLQQSINEGRTAVTLSPRSAINWEILAQLYRQISGVAQNALVFSLDAYGRAIFQDPLNPLLRLNVGGTYYAIKNYDLAIRFFTDSVNLKPDFANGFYNLSVALRDKGDLNGALQAAERVVQLVEPTSADYKVASDYLNDLKTKAGGPSQPPAATTSGQLQNEKLPKVVNVGNPPEKIATPEAIKKPTPTPTPAP